MKTIFKYPLTVAMRQRVPLPVGAEILHVGFQDGALFLWALVELAESVVCWRALETYGTGHVIPPGERRYLGTVMEQGGMLVWHLFELL